MKRSTLYYVALKQNEEIITRRLATFAKRLAKAMEEQCRTDGTDTLELSTVCDVIQETLRKEL